MDQNGKFTRRDFLKTSAIVTAAKDIPTTFLKFRKNPRANTKVTKVKTRGHEAFLCDLVVAFVPYVVAPGFRLLLPQLLVHDDERAESMQIVRVPRAI